MTYFEISTLAWCAVSLIILVYSEYQSTKDIDRMVKKQIEEAFKPTYKA